VARLEQREIYREICGRPRVRLDVCVIDFEQRSGPLYRYRLDLIDVALALVVTASRVAFGIFVGENRSGRFKHRFGNVVLRRNQSDRIDLVPLFILDEPINLRVSSLEFVHTAPPLPSSNEPIGADATTQKRRKKLGMKFFSPPAGARKFFNSL